MKSSGGYILSAYNLGPPLINPSRAIERILSRVTGWARLSNAAAFAKQNDVQIGIEDCHRELAACTDRFMVCQAYAT